MSPQMTCLLQAHNCGPIKVDAETQPLSHDLPAAISASNGLASAIAPAASISRVPLREGRPNPAPDPTQPTPATCSIARLSDRMSDNSVNCTPPSRSIV